MVKTYPVIRDDGKVEYWSKKDFVIRNIKRNLRGFKKAYIVPKTNCEELWMIYEKPVRGGGGDGEIAFFKEEKYLYTRDNMSSCFYFVRFI